MRGIISDIFTNKVVVENIVYVIGWILVNIITPNLKNLGFGKYKRRLTFDDINKKYNALMKYNIIALGISIVTVIVLLITSEIYIKYANLNDSIIIVAWCLMQMGIIRDLVNYVYFPQIVIMSIMVISAVIYYKSIQYIIREVLSYNKKKIRFYNIQCAVCYLPIFLTFFKGNWLAIITYILYFCIVISGLMYYSDMKVTKLEMRTNIFLTVGDNIIGISSKNVKRKDNFLMIITENRKIEIPYDKIKRIESIEEND